MDDCRTCEHNTGRGCRLYEAGYTCRHNMTEYTIPKYSPDRAGAVRSALEEINGGGILIDYIERNYLDAYRCIDTPRRLQARRYFMQGGLVYCYGSGGYISGVISSDDIRKITALN